MIFNFANAARFFVLGTVAALALPLAAQEGSIRDRLPEETAMVPSSAVPALSAAPGGRPTQIDGAFAERSGQPLAQSFTLPQQPFELMPRRRPLVDEVPARSYRVPAGKGDVGAQPIDLEERFMPGLSGDLEEFIPRRTFTFRL